jgi:hypothetical protein
MGKALLAIGLAVGGLLLFAQSESRSKPGFASVKTILTVELRHDHERNVPSLNREDVMAYERHEHLRLTDLVAFTGENAGMELFILIDDASDPKLGSQFGDLRGFIEAQPATAAIGIGYMQHGTVDMAQNLTADHGRAAHALQLPIWSGDASPYLSLSDLIKRWPVSAARREVVMVTSGVDVLGGPLPMNPYLDAVIESAQRNEIVVNTDLHVWRAGHAGHSFFRLNWGQNHPAQRAEETGGEAYMLGFGSPVSFAPYLDEIAAYLAHQYRVSFLIMPEDKGGLLDVKFGTETSNAELVSPGRGRAVPEVSIVNKENNRLLTEPLKNKWSAI